MDYQLDDAMVKSLKKCSTKEAVEAVFTDSPANGNDGLKMAYLRRCLGDPKVFFSGGGNDEEETNIASEYLTLLSMFLTRSWQASKRVRQVSEN